MAELLKTSITGSISDTGSLIVSGSQPITLPQLQSGSGEVYLGNGTSDLGKTNQFWFDSGDNYVKYNVNGSYQDGTWTTGPDTIVARKSVAGAGTANAGLAIGGDNPPSSFFSCTEHFSGTTWSVGGALIQARSGIGTVGTENAALASGGCNTPVSQKLTCTEEYDGSSWSAGGALSTGRYGLVGAGTQNSAAMFGGYNVPTIVACTEEYNGTSYATGGAMIQARTMLSSGGTQNAALATSGVCSGVRNNTEKYDGTSWSATAALNNGRYNQGRGSLGSQNSSIVFAGVISSPTAVACTEQFDGTTWTNVGAMVQANRGAAGFGDQGDSVSSHGISDTTDTQIWTRPFVRPFSCFTPGAWSSGGNLITAREALSGNAPAISAGIVAGGCHGVPVGLMYACTEEYNGSAWSNGGAMINARGLLAGFGTQNAQVAAGGSTSMPTDTSALTEEYDGSSWSAATAMPTAIRVGARAGTTAHAGLVFGGSNGAKTQEYDGTNWSAGGNAITAAIAAGGGGESNAAVKIGGELGALQTCVEHYDGTSWSTATAYPLVTCAVQFTGLQNAGLAFGGATFPSPSDDTLDNTYIYDGTSWSADASLSCGRRMTAGNGTQNEAFAAGGRGPSYLNVTEEYCRPFICTSAACTSVAPGAWSDVGNMITTKCFLATNGTSNASLLNVTHGYPTLISRKTEEFNGSSFSAAADRTNAHVAASSAGTQDAAFLFSGNNQQIQCTCTEEYNGTAWSAGGAVIVSRYAAGTSGTQNAGLASGGTSPTYVACTEEYDGSSWSTGGAMNFTIGDKYTMAAGTQNATVTAGGYGTPAASSCTEEYNDTAWSAGGAMSIARRIAGGGGSTQNDFVISGGYTPSTWVATENYNGTSWSSGVNLPNGGYGKAGTRDGGDSSNYNVFGNMNESVQATTACNFQFTTPCVVGFYNFRSCLRCLEGTTTPL